MKSIPCLFQKGRPVFLGLILLTAGCSKDDPDSLDPSARTNNFSYELPLAWNKLYLDLERFTPGYRPPVSARTLAYVNLAAYESVWPGMAGDYNSMADQWPGLALPQPESGKEYHWPSSMNAAYVEIMELFFPTAPAEQLYRIYALQTDYALIYKQQVPNDVYARSAAFGRSVANAVFNWSASDAAGHEAYLRNNDPGYVPPAGTGIWQPTYPDFTPALLPHWGDVRTFAADNSDVAPNPLAYSEIPSSDLYQQALAVKNLVTGIKNGHADEDAWIADFWSDDCPILTFTPAGRWIAVLNQVVERNKLHMDKAIEAYARIGLALSDAGVRAWHEKYRFNVERPIDYIRRVQNDPEWNTVMCPDGSGRFFTPPFPAYPSGHATFGAAAAEVMTALFGAGYPMTDRCHEGRTEFNGTPRSFNNFYEMAEENAYSRIPIGVHFKMDSDAGLELGYGIGKKINALPWRN